MTNTSPGTQPAHPSDLLLGITTYNRLDTVALTARSLRHADGVAEVGILLIDDASTEYGLEALRPLFPPQTQLLRNAVNSGRADFAAHGLMRAFVEQRSEAALVILDSDLLVARDFLATALAVFPRTDGLLSLFNAHSHPGVMRDGLLVKQSVGFAGTVWSRALVEEVLREVPPTDRFDWDICDHLRATGRQVFCLPDSAVQHAGLLAGQNSRLLSADYGLGFTDTSWYNLSVLQEMLLFGVRQELRTAGAALGRLAEMEARVEALQAEVAQLRRQVRSKRHRS